MRVRSVLEDDWWFATDLDAPAVVPPGDPSPPSGRWRRIRVPGHWQGQFRELVRATGPVWYRYELDLDAEWLAADTLALEFGAVGHFCQGWLNRSYLGDHDGGHLPFSWSLDGCGRVGRNELLVRVVSPSGDRSRYPAFPFDEILHGKQSWYGPAGGLWQQVAVEARSAHAVRELSVRPLPDAHAVEVRVELWSTLETAAVSVEVTDPDGVPCARADVVAGEATAVRLHAEHRLRRWSPGTPDLYHVCATVAVGERVVDRVRQRCGFRSFAAVDGRFVLNGAPIELRGVLDQDYDDGGAVPPSRADLQDRFELLKRFGFNALRCHVKVPDPSYLDVADEVGLLVWCELPTTSRLSPRAMERIDQTLAGFVARDRHHPCIVVWGVANEAWGYDLVGDPEHRARLRRSFHELKAMVPDHLVVDNSPCTPNFHIETDIEDYHFYAVLPEMRRRWDDFLEAFANRSWSTFSPHGDARRTGTEPLVVSEFGAWGLPDLSDLEADEPWWFETGQEWAGGAAYVHGARERFRQWHLDKVFGDWHGLCVETQRRQFVTLQYQIESMRARPEIAGYVLTEFRDVHWEANGLLDMRDRPRTFVDALPELNGTPALIARLGRWAVWDGDDVTAEVTVINDGAPTSELRLECTTTRGGHQSATAVEPLAAWERRALGTHRTVARCDGVPSAFDIDYRLTDVDGWIAGTRRSVLVVPRVDAQLGGDQQITVTDPELRDRLVGLGYAVAGPEVDAPLRVVRQMTPDDHGYLRRGGRLLVLATQDDALGGGFGDFPPVALAPWDVALYGGGEWVSAFSWLRRTGRFADLPGGPILDLWLEGLSPQVVITGLPPARFECDVFAGVFVGWVHQVAALIARHHVGLGSVLISTLDVTGQALGADPVATWLLHQLIATARE